VEHWAAVRSTRGVTCLVEFGGVAECVPSDLINVLCIELFAAGEQPTIVDMSAHEGFLKLIVLSKPLSSDETTRLCALKKWLITTVGFVPLICSGRVVHIKNDSYGQYFIVD